MSAVANTPSDIINNDLSPQLDLWGNVLQGTGTALIADSKEEFSFEKLGNQLESIGNLVTVMDIIVPVSDEMKFDEKGDIIETLGVSVSLPDELEDGFSLETFFDFYGHFLSVIEMKGADEEFVDMVAEW